MTRFFRYTRPHGAGLALVLMLMLVGVGLEALKPWPLKLIVDNVLGGRSLPVGAEPVTALAWLALSTVVLFAATQAVRLAQGYVQSGVGARMAYALGADLFDHLQRLSLRYHGRRPAGDLVRRVTVDSGCVRELVLGVMLPLVSSLVTLVVMFVVMWKLDPVLALLALLAAPPLGWLIKIFAAPMTERAYQQQQLEGEMMALAEQTLTALPVVQAFTREAYEERRFRRLSRRTVQAYLRATVAQLQFKISTGVVTAVATAALVVVGGAHVLHGPLTVGSLLVFLAYLSALYAPLETLAYLASGWASAAGRARRVMEVLEAEDRVRDEPTAMPVPARAAGRVRLENVTFGYEPGRAVLRDVSLEAGPGETVALVGPTGAGKSTLVSLIPRFFDPWEGRVTLDGTDLQRLQLASLRAQVALVLQEPFLLPLTVAQNIAYGRPMASAAEITAAAVAARADEFIRRLPKGYDTVIGERGATLSGGEKQRLAIARALLKDAPVLILDEPTAALDAQTETLLLAALEQLMQGRTTFIIAHRLSTVRRATRIVVLEAGRVVETGAHAQLLAAGGAYRRFHDLLSATKEGQ